ncbi:MAG: hypothetical protein IJU76_05100 [Desulfovibrionaceae bacterium]|nr:hypothetical protein [Desulfovibrionaceae bacterium]
MFGGLKNLALDKAFKVICEQFINPRIKDFGTVEQINYQKGCLCCKVILLGLEDVPLEIYCRSIAINSDCSAVKLSNFSANKPFLENALNTFATKEIPVPDSPMLRQGLSLLKKML